MLIRMTTQLIWHGREILPDETIDLPDDVARRYVATRQAELIHNTPSPVEAASVSHTCNAARDMRPQQKRG